ncbi:OmpW family outer membrane protein [Maribacter hydrothermalis]|uniref:Outer membrane protein beta-barrel domain-containing protein n=1 Tax=Maribacter hydrothermalis TaxID=1836467 RepID=A0A1B7ZC15_9FLAO|nr:OmpW family outer membrane protein [Maribacter hydrothermalis]APQ16008.1 hypothetical protein BTR34_01035 [Maribacter hydrothermalis]OBR40425.1 hypothetical protein A9200_16240 [Maribacter hydrothermalis]
MLRNEILAIIFLIVCGHTFFAQEKNRFKVGVNLGAALASDAGVLMCVEPKYNINDNNSIGLRLGVTFVLGRNINEPINSQYIIEEGLSLHETYSLVATFDRYLGKSNSRFQPFVGGGISYYKLSKLNQVSTIDNSNVNLASVTKVEGQIGLLIRSGFEFGKFRFGIAYNVIPKSKIQLSNGDIAGSVQDSYLGASIGCIFGEGKN